MNDYCNLEAEVDKDIRYVVMHCNALCIDNLLHTELLTYLFTYKLFSPIALITLWHSWSY